MAAALLTGWWWYYYEPQDKVAIQAFALVHPAQMHIRKTFSGNAGGEIIVFEVTGQPLVWPFSTWPTQAPKGLATEPKDIVATAGTSPVTSLRALLEELTGKPWEAIKETAASANTALKIVIFGAAAILLWNLYRSTAPE